MKYNMISFNKKFGEIGICGHIGVGHTHSHSGFVQDDGAGFAVVAKLLKETYPIDTTITSVNVDINSSEISIETSDGGIGIVTIPSGITPWEKSIIEGIKNVDALLNQQIVLKSFGRIYGQGAMEVGASLQGAIAMSVIDTFAKKYPQDVVVLDEDIPINNGKILGAIVEIEGSKISLMLTINSTKGGLGPIEDLEGNILLGNKGNLMKQLNLDKIPTIIVESKNYSPDACSRLDENTFLIRGNKQFDNMIVGNALIEGTKAEKLPYLFNFDAFNRGNEDFSEASKKLGDKIVNLGEELKSSETSMEKVKIIYKLNKLAREEAGGVTFMSNDLNKSVGGAGILQGTSSVLSLLVTKKYIDYEKIPYMTMMDLENYIRIIKRAIPFIRSNYEEALKELEEKWNFNELEYNNLIEK